MKHVSYFITLLFSLFLFSSCVHDELIIETETYPLVSSKLSSETGGKFSGGFFLGTGTISGAFGPEKWFSFYMKTEHGIKLIEVKNTDDYNNIMIGSRNDNAIAEIACDFLIPYCSTGSTAYDPVVNIHLIDNNEDPYVIVSYCKYAKRKLRYGVEHVIFMYDLYVPEYSIGSLHDFTLK